MILNVFEGLKRIFVELKNFEFERFRMASTLSYTRFSQSCVVSDCYLFSASQSTMVSPDFPSGIVYYCWCMFYVTMFCLIVFLCISFFCMFVEVCLLFHLMCQSANNEEGDCPWHCPIRSHWPPPRVHSIWAVHTSCKTFLGPR